MASLLIAGACAWTFYVLVRSGVVVARTYLADALLMALTFMLAGTLLKAITLGGWQQIGFFAVVFSLRALIKLTLKGECHAAARLHPRATVAAPRRRGEWLP